MLNEKQLELIEAWNEVKSELSHLKDEESSLRERVYKEIFNSNEKNGTHYIDLSNGYRLKLVCKTNFNFVDAESLESACDKLNSTPEGFVIAQRLVKWTPELVLSEYKKLLSDHKFIIDEALVTKPAKPTIELVEPKVT